MSIVATHTPESSRHRRDCCDDGAHTEAEMARTDGICPWIEVRCDYCLALQPLEELVIEFGAPVVLDRIEAGVEFFCERCARRLP